MLKNSKTKIALKIKDLRSNNCHAPCPLTLSSSRRSTWAILCITGLIYSVLPLIICVGWVLEICTASRTNLSSGLVPVLVTEKTIELGSPLWSGCLSAKWRARLLLSEFLRMSSVCCCTRVHIHIRESYWKWVNFQCVRHLGTCDATEVKSS